MTLRALTLHHPKPDELGQALGALNLSGRVQSSDKPTIQAELDTPRGVVVL